MTAFIIHRLIQTFVVIIIVTFISFFLLLLVPGDPALIMLGSDAAQEELDALRHELWLDRPLLVQYGHWLFNVLHGDFGKSLFYHENVSAVFLRTLPVSTYLGLLSLVVSSIFGILAGIICAVRRGGLLDQTISVFANIGVAIPIFWLGILGIYFIALKLGWLPIQGYTSPFVDFGKSTAQAVMPVICQAIMPVSILARQTRSSMLEVISQDYIRTAMAKGLKQRVVVLKHALKNALIPVVTLLGLQIRMIVGGSVLVETVFNIPGIGRLLVGSAFNKDFLVVQAGVLLTALVVCLVNLIVDISYGWLDPRIRYEY